MRSILLLVLAALSPACTMSQPGKNTLIAAGIATTVAGAVLVSAGPGEVDSNSNGVNEWALNDDYSKPLLGSMLVMAGLAAVLGGLTARTPPEPAPAVIVAPPIAVSEQAPGATEIDQQRDPGVRPSLPEVAVDEQTLRLALTMRTAVMAGNCEAARLLLGRIAASSHAYHEALVAGPVLDPCPRLRERFRASACESGC